MKALYENSLVFSANTVFRVGECSAAQTFCSWLVSGLQICTGALVIW